MKAVTVFLNYPGSLKLKMRLGLLVIGRKDAHTLYRGTVVIHNFPLVAQSNRTWMFSKFILCYNLLQRH
jgi:hypothetical protein